MSLLINNPTSLIQSNRHLDDSLIAEDTLLLLFKPTSNTIAGENTLFYVLGGAVLTDLAINGHVTVEEMGRRGSHVEVIGNAAPTDPVLKSAWDYIVEKPRSPHTVIAAIGPNLRSQLLDRLVERGDLLRTERKVFGIFRTSTLEEGSTGRRADLVAQVRAVLVNGGAPTARIGAISALISASKSLPTFYDEIPWTSDVIARASELEKGHWGADTAAEAVTRTMNSVIINAMIASNVVSRG